MIGPSLALPEGEGSKNALSLLSPPLGELEGAFRPCHPDEGRICKTNARSIILLHTNRHKHIPDFGNTTVISD